MMTTLNLKELEKKAWRSMFQDGIWDLYLGMLLLAFAVSALLSDTGVAETPAMIVFVGVEVLAVAVLFAGKKWITIPRMGRATFHKVRSNRILTVRVMLMLSTLLGLIVFFLTIGYRNRLDVLGDPRVVFPAIWMINCLVLFGVGAYFLDFPRLLGIGVLYAITVPLDHLLTDLLRIDASALGFGIPALIILAMGAVLLNRFLREYPLPDTTADAEGAANHGSYHSAE